MPWRPPRRCLRCRALITGQRCPTCETARSHLRPAWATRSKNWPADLSTAQWTRVRNAFITDHPWCEWCGARAQEVDHRDGTDYETQRYDPSMLRSLCTPCHRQRTAAASVAARRAKRNREDHP